MADRAATIQSVRPVLKETYPRVSTPFSRRGQVLDQVFSRSVLKAPRYAELMRRRSSRGRNL